MNPTHPTEVQLALYSGRDLSFFEQRRVGRHVAKCADCRAAVSLYEIGDASVRELAAELPEDLNWGRLSQEMTGNIRVGLAAGECIAGFEKSFRPARPRFFWHTASIIGCASVIVFAALWLNLPEVQKDHLAGSLTKMGSVRWERIGSGVRGTNTAAADSVILEASPSAIQVKSNGQALSLMHPHSDGGTVSVNMQDSAGVRYVDADTGQVTINRVYYAQ